LLIVAAAETSAWYRGCYEDLLGTENASLSVVGFVNPVDCGQTCLGKGYLEFILTIDLYLMEKSE